MKKMNLHASEQSGFTLIELIMVIVILGILSAFALPKFADFSGQAADASIQGAVGAIKAGSAIAHAQFLANGSTGTTVTLEGATIDLTNGYPSGSDLGDLVDLTGYVLNTGVTPPIISQGGDAGDNCFTYTDATTTVPPVISAIGTYGEGATAANTDDTCS